MSAIKTTWGKVFEKDNICIFNKFPSILQELEQYDELYQWEDYDDETDTYNEVYQWYIIPSDYTVRWLKKYCPEIAEDIHYSDTIGHYVMAVRHWGTGWDYVPTTLEVDDKDLAEIYQKTYHDDLSNDVKRMVFNEKIEEK